MPPVGPRCRSRHVRIAVMVISHREGCFGVVPAVLYAGRTVGKGAEVSTALERTGCELLVASV
jgi:hypothetical protein